MTHAERALLEFADIDNIHRGEFAVCGTSADPADPSNDPKDAIRWTRDRDIRVELIQWLAIDRSASDRIDPKGLRALGARIVGSLDLSRVQVPFGIMFARCWIAEPMNLEGATIPFLGLQGSYTSEIDGIELNVGQDLDFGSKIRDFHSSGPIVLDGAKVGGWIILSGAHVRYSPPRLINPLVLGNQNAALSLDEVEVGHDLLLCCGFESVGAVLVDDASIGGILDCGAARFINPNGAALAAGETIIKGTVWLAQNPYGYGGNFEADGVVYFTGAQVGGHFYVTRAKFGGKATEQHGFVAEVLNMHGGLVWQDVDLENGALLDLTGASVLALLDNARSWPQPGKLMIDGFSYNSFGSAMFDSPHDARSRLRWLGLQAGFHPQPYRQLAKVLRENGDDAGAIEVLIAKEDARFRNSNWLGHAWARFLKITIGYGHKPLRTVLWSLAVILIGWLLVTAGARAGVMRATWPDSPPSSETIAYEKLHPLLYSLDVFLPFVNLHQEHYWWPDAERSGDCTLYGRKMRISGAFLRYYLWMQVIAGWLLSAIFVAGVTGLMRND